MPQLGVDYPARKTSPRARLVLVLWGGRLLSYSGIALMLWLLVDASGSTPDAMAGRVLYGDVPAAHGSAEEARVALHAAQAGAEAYRTARLGEASTARKEPRLQQSEAGGASSPVGVPPQAATAVLHSQLAGESDTEPGAIDPARLFRAPAAAPEGGLVGAAKRLAAPLADFSSEAVVAVTDDQVNEIRAVLADTAVAFRQLGSIYERTDALAKRLNESASDAPIVENVAGLLPEQKGDVQRFLRQLRGQDRGVDTRVLLWDHVGHPNLTSVKRTWEPRRLGAKSCAELGVECDATLQRLTKDAAESETHVTRGGIERAFELNAIAVVLSQQLHNIVGHLAGLDRATGRRLFVETFAEFPRWVAPLPIRWGLEKEGARLHLVERYRVGREDAHGSLYRYADAMLGDLRALAELLAAGRAACTTATSHYPKATKSYRGQPMARELNELLGSLWPAKLKEAELVLLAATKEWEAAQEHYRAFVQERPRAYSELLAFTKRLRGSPTRLALPAEVSDMPRDQRESVLAIFGAVLKRAEQAGRVARSSLHYADWPDTKALEGESAAMQARIRRPLHFDSGADIFLRNCDPVYVPPFTR